MQRQARPWRGGRAAAAAGGRCRLFALGLLAAGLGLAGLSRSAAATDVDLLGTWYVLVHYQDRSTANPDAWHWEDRVWRFERKGSRLRWVEYPIVVFTDETGRFEGRQRVLAAWEPNEGQWKEIRSGLQVNSRGSKSKSLRKSKGGAEWKTVGGMQIGSASTIGYFEDWYITGLPDAPVFTRDDVLGSGRAEEMEGRTRFTTTEVLDGGNELRGTFNRDGTREGIFRMVRSGESRGIDTAARTREEQDRRSVEHVRQQFTGGPGARAAVARTIGQQLGAAGVRLPASELDALAGEALQLASQGLGEGEVVSRLEASAREKYFSFAEKGATPDPTARYELPFDPSVPRRLMQGANGNAGHEGVHAYSFDFEMPVGTAVRAARGGRVARVVDGFSEGGPRPSLQGKANAVVVVHDDGTFATYAHLSKGIDVEPGQAIARGDVLGRSGNTGYTTAPHLHFSVWRLDREGRGESVPIRFDDGSPDGYVPAEGGYYGSESPQRAG